MGTLALSFAGSNGNWIWGGSAGFRFTVPLGYRLYLDNLGSYANGLATFPYANLSVRIENIANPGVVLAQVTTGGAVYFDTSDLVNSVGYSAVSAVLPPGTYIAYAYGYDATTPAYSQAEPIPGSVPVFNDLGGLLTFDGYYTEATPDVPTTPSAQAVGGATFTGTLRKTGRKMLPLVLGLVDLPTATDFSLPSNKQYDWTDAAYYLVTTAGNLNFIDATGRDQSMTGLVVNDVITVAIKNIKATSTAVIKKGVAARNAF